MKNLDLIPTFYLVTMVASIAFFLYVVVNASLQAEETNHCSKEVCHQEILSYAERLCDYEN
jgi:hypothetical protein